MNRQEWERWNSWANPLWSWIVAALVLGISAYGYYIIGAYTVPRGDYISAILGSLYFALFAWGAGVFAFRAVELSKKDKR